MVETTASLTDGPGRSSQKQVAGLPTLPPAQVKMLVALYRGELPIKNAATRKALRNYHYVTDEDTDQNDWTNLAITNAGREWLQHKGLLATNGNGSESPLRFKPDDDELSLLLAEEWRGLVAHFQSNWRVYDQGVWSQRDIHQVRKNVREFLRKHRERLPGGVLQGRINSITAMLADDAYITDQIINEAQRAGEHYINLQNGLFNLETMKLEPHNPDLYFTAQLDFPYDPEAQCPVFKRFLRTSLATEDGFEDDKMIWLAQEALAYSMTARTDLKASFWCVGKPDTGKSTLIGFIRSLMGSLHETIDLNQLAANRFLLSGIVGKRVVTFTEADTNSFLPDALYKAMVGGRDSIYVDVKNKPGFSFVPISKFWWAMNGAPRTSDRSGATFNRLMPILFERPIPQNEKDPELDRKLAAEKAGVFNYLLAGYQRLQKYGAFTLPDRSAQWREDYRHENDTEYLFFQDCLEKQVDARLPGAELYGAYSTWCINNNFRPKNLGQIGKEWRRLGLIPSILNGRHFWAGAKFRLSGGGKS